MAQSTPDNTFSDKAYVPVTDERGVRFPYTPPLFKKSSEGNCFPRIFCFGRSLNVGLFYSFENAFYLRP